MPHYRSADGLSLHFTDEGTGTPILCLPGLTRNGRDFDHVAPHLSGFRLIRPDYRGRGGSDRSDPATYTIPQETQDVLALMDHLGLEKAAILGTSRGGLIAMVMGALARDRLLGVAFNDIGPDIAKTGMDMIMTYLGIPPPQKTWAAAAEARAKYWTAFEDVPMDRWLAEVRGQFDQTADGLTLRYDPRLRDTVAASLALPPIDLWPLFDGLAGVPLALIRGANSDLLTTRTADEMSRRRPDMIRADVPGRGHVPFLDEPQALGVLHRWTDLL